MMRTISLFYFNYDVSRSVGWAVIVTFFVPAHPSGFQFGTMFERL
jgi:hypothetical protein